MAFPRLSTFQSKHPPVARGEGTHWMARDRFFDHAYGGYINGKDAEDELLSAYSEDLANTDAIYAPIANVYERLGARFRFFMVLTFSPLAEPPAVRAMAEAVVEIAAEAMHPTERRSAFFAALDPRSLACHVLSNEEEMRLVFPEVIVDVTRALHLHRWILDCLNTRLAYEHKQTLFQEYVHEQSFAVPNSQRWLRISPTHCYTSGEGMPLVKSAYVTRCKALVTPSGKTCVSHKRCDACRHTGYVQGSQRFELMLSRGCEPADVVSATCVRTDAPLSEPYVVPEYAPVVPMRVDRLGKSVLAECFEGERASFAGSRTQKELMDLDTRSLRDVVLHSQILAHCRGMHSQFSRIGVQKIVRLLGAKPAVRVHSEGECATFCMRHQRFHTSCRATFLLEEVGGRGQIVQECFAPECATAGRRYRSNARVLSAQLCETLGFGGRGLRDASSEEAWLDECAERLDRQRRGERVEPYGARYRHKRPRGFAQ